jgi:ubiquinone/menaquinone biosynthesis C-methylase UbiE
MSPDRNDQSVPPVVDQMVHDDGLADGYEDLYGNLRLWQYDSRLLDEWFDVPGRLLDLGCGHGRTLLQFARKGFEVTGLDLSPRMLVLAEQRLKAEGLSAAALVEGNLADLPMDRFAPPYDYAVCMFATLGFVRGHANRVRALRQACRLLKPGGQYVFHVQNLLYNVHTLHLPFILTGLAKWAVGRGEIGDQIFWWYENLRWLYMHAFRPKELRRLVAEAGLDLVDFARINARLDGPLQATRLRDWRSHGYILRCRRPMELA